MARKVRVEFEGVIYHGSEVRSFVCKPGRSSGKFLRVHAFPKRVADFPRSTTCGCDLPS